MSNIPYAIMHIAAAATACNMGIRSKAEGIRQISDALHAGIRAALWHADLTILRLLIAGGTTHTEDGTAVQCAALHKDKDFPRILRAIYTATGGVERGAEKDIFRPELSVLRYDAKTKTLEFSGNPRNMRKVINRICVAYADYASATYEDMQPREPEKAFTFDQVRAFIKRLTAQKKNWSPADRSALESFHNLVSDFAYSPAENRPETTVPRQISRLDGKPKLATV